MTRRGFVPLLLAVAFAAGRKERPVKLKNETYDELMPIDAADRAFVAVRCETIEFVNRGTRSERVILHTRIVAGRPGPPGAALSLSRFTQNDPVMKTGQTYLAAAYRGEWLPAWNLVECVLVDPAGAEKAVKAAEEEMVRREGK